MKTPTWESTTIASQMSSADDANYDSSGEELDEALQVAFDFISRWALIALYNQTKVQNTSWQVRESDANNRTLVTSVCARRSQ